MYQILYMAGPKANRADSLRVIAIVIHLSKLLLDGMEAPLLRRKDTSLLWSKGILVADQEVTSLNTF